MTDLASRAELPACPFCGGAAELIETPGDWGYRPATYYVSCNKCDCETVQHGTAKKAIAAWSRRAPVSGFAAGVEAAAKVCESRRPPRPWNNFDEAADVVLVDTAHRIRTLPSPDAGVVEKFRTLAENATQGAVAVRPVEYDDWGWIRAADNHLVAMARAGITLSEEDLDVHRVNKTDPYGHNAAFIAWCFNNRALILAALRTIGETEER